MKPRRASAPPEMAAASAEVAMECSSERSMPASSEEATHSKKRRVVRYVEPDEEVVVVRKEISQPVSRPR